MGPCREETPSLLGLVHKLTECLVPQLDTFIQFPLSVQCVWNLYHFLVLRGCPPPCRPWVRKGGGSGGGGWELFPVPVIQITFGLQSQGFPKLWGSSIFVCFPSSFPSRPTRSASNISSLVPRAQRNCSSLDRLTWEIFYYYYYIGFPWEIRLLLTIIWAWSKPEPLITDHHNANNNYEKPKHCAEYRNPTERREVSKWCLKNGTDLLSTGLPQTFNLQITVVAKRSKMRPVFLFTMFQIPLNIYSQSNFDILEQKHSFFKKPLFFNLHISSINADLTPQCRADKGAGKDISWNERKVLFHIIS